MSPLVSWIRRTPLVALVLVVVTGAGAGAAYAYWTSTDSSKPAVATGDTIPRGATPTATLGGATTVTTTFNAVTTAGGRAVTSYLISRYGSATGGSPVATFICTAAGTTATCSETGVPEGVWYYSDTPQLTGSLWTGQESVRSGAVSTDATAPTVTATVTPTPNAAGWNNTTPVTVGLSATDSGSGVASITYWIDSGTRTTVAAASTNVVVSGQGSRILSYYATDAVGNVSATLTKQVNTDSVKPVVAGLTVPAYVNIANKGVVPVSGTITETNNSSVTIVVTGTSGTPVTKKVDLTAGATTWSTTMDLSSGPADGAITFSVTAKDVADNTSTAVTAGATKDTVAPTVTFAAQTTGLPPNRYTYTDNAGATLDQISAAAGSVQNWGSDTSLKVTATQTSPHAGLKYTSGPVSSSTGAIAAFDVEALGLLNALTVTYKLEAVDAAGNVGPNSITLSFVAAF